MREKPALEGAGLYSLILGYLGEPMRLIVPPHQNSYERYTVEHHYSQI